jgi:putative ABC transport system permease protein
VLVDAPGGETMRDDDFQAISPGYFETLGIPLVRGRLFTSRDRAGQPAVSVVNQAFVRRFLPLEGDPIGHGLRRSPQAPWITIVGVVNDIRRGGKTAPVNPQVYLSAAQIELYPVRLADFAVRAGVDPQQLVIDIRKQVWEVDKDQPVTNVKTMEEIISASVAQRRFQMMLLLVFAAVALSLASIGIFGVLSHAVSQRTPELGIRMALGAGRRDILALVFRQAAALISAGIAIGVAGALALSRYVQSLLFGVQPQDWGAYSIAISVFLLVALLASAIPARRATRVDPMVALRYE